jgi:AcrR family transcriptional regulator
VTTPSLSGRKAQAARNDSAILAAAQRVFVQDPGAPIAAVAQRAGVGISALYRRYPSKEDLLRALCADGLCRFVAIVEESLNGRQEPWDAFVSFLREVVDADLHSLTVHLAGTFTPTPEMHELAIRSSALVGRLLRRAKAAKVIRSDFQAADIAMLFEQLAAIRVGDQRRTEALRERYLTLILDGLRPAAATGRLPASPPTSAESGARWAPRTG